MEIMFHITCENALEVALPLSKACQRAGISWGCFLTGDGVKTLGDKGFVSTLASAGAAVVCEHSWQQHMNGISCPVELGSQTINSRMVGDAVRVISL